MLNFTDHQSLISALGGAPSIAPACGVGQVNVRAWGMRNRIPPEYWPPVISLAHEKALRKVSAEWLMKTTPARKRADVEAEGVPA